MQQVRQAIRMGRLEPGDQLPTAREVSERTGINPNTVLKAYRELELAGLVEARQGSGTFVREHLAPLPAADRRTDHAPELMVPARRPYPPRASRTARTMRITPVSRSTTTSTDGRVSHACSRSISRM